MCIYIIVESGTIFVIFLFSGKCVLLTFDSLLLLLYGTCLAWLLAARIRGGKKRRDASSGDWRESGSFHWRFCLQRSDSRHLICRSSIFLVPNLGKEARERIKRAEGDVRSACSGQEDVSFFLNQQTITRSETKRSRRELRIFASDKLFGI
ncbi:hypothetical protein V8C26DRAFT_411331 [Trichoderma gracile]